ncbi:Mitochondrial substrate/solute carrier [Penicillium italicum]|uniref:Mitochondrial substrate/solute carrier n=1 Tax=Penicillium italicum TaxID=40296 RepID=A0A0A2LLF1_PENIT|nr:Mitochondrial substrate/solute carrier [Penicillium italicum]
MQFLYALAVFCSLLQFVTLVSAENTSPSADLESKEADTSPSLPANLVLQRNAAITSQVAAGLALGVKRMSDDEGEKFFLDYWSLGDSLLSSNISERHLSDEDGFSPARFVAQSYPFEPSYSLGSDGDRGLIPQEYRDSTNNLFEKRDFKCPTGTWACISIGRSDRCCGSGEMCEIVADTGHGDVGCCPNWKTCSGMIGSCAYITVITVTVHSTMVLSTMTYSTKPHDSTSTSTPCSSPTTYSYSSKSTTNDSLAPPARPTNLSTVTSATRGADVCPTGFYACSAVYQGGCCRTGRDCDTTSCPTTSSTTMISDGVTIVAPVATTTHRSGGNRDVAFGTTVAKEQATATSGDAAIMSETPQKPLPFVYQFAAGAVAGVSEVPSGRAQDSNLQTGPAVPGVDHYNGMFDCFRKIVKNEGASRLYRGISAPILMEAPKRATKFAANDSWGAFYRNLFGVDKQTQGLATLTGATAGATEAFVVVPFELVKIRLQDKAQAHKYNGMLDVVKKIVAAEGPLALYNGLESTMWRHVLWNAGYFGCIFQVRAQLPAVEPGNKNQQTRNDLIAGSIGGITGTLLNTPMDVVKSRIQNTSKVPGQVAKYNWAWPALGTVMKEEGFAALYKGFTPKVLRLGPGGGILLVVYTGVMDFFRKMRDEK